MPNVKSKTKVYTLIPEGGDICTFGSIAALVESEELQEAGISENSLYEVFSRKKEKSYYSPTGDIEIHKTELIKKSRK